MNYAQSIEWVEQLQRFGETPGLVQIQELLTALGNPQRRLRFIHISGTNGKGSATVMLASILKQAGFSTGAFLSPFLLDFREHFQINGTLAPEDDVAWALSQVRQSAQALTFPIIRFVAITAAAFLIFVKANCQLVCLETGIGGKHDCTNCIASPLLSIIMQVGTDHASILGSSLEEIASEKAGILKPGRPAICYPNQPQKALHEIVKTASELDCQLTIPNPEDIHFHLGGPFENRINYGGYDLLVPFPGVHQAYNAAVVIEAALSLWRQGYAISDDHIVQGIENAYIPARIEILRYRPLVILDGAHNSDSAKALATTLHNNKISNLTVIAGMLQDKDAKSILLELKPYIRTLYTVTPPDDRALPGQELAQLAKPFIPGVKYIPTVEQALQLARQAGSNGILIVGSLHLASQAKKFLAH